MLVQAEQFVLPIDFDDSIRVGDLPDEAQRAL